MSRIGTEKGVCFLTCTWGLNHRDNRQALKRLEELAARKDENVVEVSNVEVPRSQNPIEIHFSGEP